MHDDDMETFAPPKAQGYEAPIDLTRATEEFMASDFAKGFDLWVEQEMSDKKNQPPLDVPLGSITAEQAEQLLRAFSHASTEGCKGCQAFIFQFMTSVFKTIVDEMVRRDGMQED